MDPERVRAYLQVACAGLGFDIGEVWWTSNQNGSSTLMAIEEKKDENGSSITPSDQDPSRKRFVQLYTSKSYTDRRADLVNPDADVQEEQASSSADVEKKHVLSPQLVDAISSTAQVVWANCEKREGLLGRSDMRLQTAVGMPVAVDAEGNMCVVVMFSPENIESTDDAMEYLQFISRSATSSSIPCLLPVFDSNTMRPALEDAHNERHVEHAHYEDPSLGDGVVAHYVSLDDTDHHHDLKDAPKDCFGIPMLPSFAELGGSMDDSIIGSDTPHSDAFDEASFGIWSTIMNSGTDNGILGYHPTRHGSLGQRFGATETESLGVIEVQTPMMPSLQKERLEEFSTAFLAMSVFDVCDVWIPQGSTKGYDSLCHVTSVTSTDANDALNQFKRESERVHIELWSGAVGRAYASGNPVWSANSSIIVDSERVASFDKANIQAALAVPIFSTGGSSPSCVVGCYSLVRADPVPTVLRFVQQALRLLWTGLESVEPHESVGKELWKDVAPADLGEMAADVEMQQEFLRKKRPHNSISFSDPNRDRSSSLSLQLQSLGLPDGNSGMPANQSVAYTADSSVAGEIPSETYNFVQSHLQEAVRAVGDAVPWMEHQHVDTNASGSKRAHVVSKTPSPPPPAEPIPMQSFPFQTSQPFPNLGLQTSTARTMSGLDVQAVNGSMPLSTSHAAPIGSLSAGAASYHMQMSAAESRSTASAVIPEPVQSFSAQYCAPAGAQSLPPGTKLCRIQGCAELAVARRPYCTRHSGSRLCEHPGCPKCAQGSTRFCIAHGGGRRCTYPGCDKGARDKFFCAAHGGGKRCSLEGCTKSAVGGSNLCTSHGGGRRCAIDGCDKSAQSSTKYCVKHGGGKKCAHPGCQKVARGRTKFCAGHGGGVRCKLEGCNRVAIGKLQLCRTHGGGSRPRSQQQHSPSPTLTPTPIQPDFGGFNGSMEV